MKEERAIAQTFRRTLEISAVGMLVFAFVFGVIEGYGAAQASIDAHRAEALDSINDRIDLLSTSINLVPRGVSDDLLFLTQLSSLESLVETQTFEWQGLFENDLLAFLNENTIYYTIEYWNIDGEFMTGASFDREKVYVDRFTHLSSVEEFQEHFDRIRMLDPGDVYVSPVILTQRENTSAVGMPVLYYGTPVVQEGEIQGLLVALVYADYFLDNVRNASHSHDEESIFLVDRGGQYLAHNNRENEFGFVTGSGISLFTHYPNIAERLLVRSQERHVEHNGKIITMRYIHPTISSFEVHQGTEKVFGKDSHNRHFWVLVSVSDMSHLEHINKQVWNNYFMIILVAGALFFIGLLFWGLARMRNIDTLAQTAARHLSRNCEVVIVSVIATLFAVVYFFSITSFFQGWRGAKWFDVVPDLLVFIVSMSIAAFALRLKGYPRMAMLTGGLLLAGVKLIEVILQEYQHMLGIPLSSWYWLPLIIIEYSAVVLLLFAVAHISVHYRRKS